MEESYERQIAQLFQQCKRSVRIKENIPEPTANCSLGLDDVVRAACADEETRRAMYRVSPQIVTGV